MTEIKHGDKTISFEIDGPFIEGDLCRLHPCTVKIPAPEPHKAATAWDKILDDGEIAGDSEVPGLIKIANSSGDEDLTENEGRILSYLFPETAKDEKFYRYLPRQIIEHFVSQGRSAKILTFLTDYITLETILKAYPAGIDYRDLAWMLKRTLAGLGFVHGKGVIHGAVLPPHIMIHPVGHGAKIIDWCYAVRPEERRSIPAYVATWKDYYPPEVFAKRLPTPATDIFMVAKICVALLGGNTTTNQIPEHVPVEIRDMLGRCLREKSAERPSSAWDLHDDFDQILQAKVGKPKYRPFVLPDGP
jgi:serine/threonine protein kinase